MKYCRLEDIPTSEFFNEHGRKALDEFFASGEFKELTEKLWQRELARRSPNACSTGEECR